VLSGSHTPDPDRPTPPDTARDRPRWHEDGTPRCRDADSKETVRRRGCRCAAGSQVAGFLLGRTVSEGGPTDDGEWAGRRREVPDALEALAAAASARDRCRQWRCEAIGLARWETLP
jgi:hypothetical protein